MLLRFDPFRDFDRLAEGASPRHSVMAMDARRSGDTVTVDLDLPGVDRSSIDITVEKNTLVVEAQRTLAAGEDDQVFAAERPHGFPPQIRIVVSTCFHERRHGPRCFCCQGHWWRY